MILSQKTYLAVFLDDSKKTYDYEIIKLNLKARIRPRFNYDGFAYRFDPTRSYHLLNMNLWDPNSRLSPILDAMATYQGVRILIYAVGDPEPLDRVSLIETDTVVNPRILQVLTKSKLFNDYLRRLNYGSAVSTKTLLILMVALGALLGVMYFGGYL